MFDENCVTYRTIRNATPVFLPYFEDTQTCPGHCEAVYGTIVIRLLREMVTAMSRILLGEDEHSFCRHGLRTEIQLHDMLTRLYVWDYFTIVVKSSWSRLCTLKSILNLNSDIEWCVMEIVSSVIVWQ